MQSNSSQTSTNSPKGFVTKDKEYTNLINYASHYIHRHSFWEFFIITKGTVTHFFNQTSLRLSAGKICLIHPGNDYHHFENISETYEHRDLYVSTTLMKQVCDMIDENLYATLIGTKSFMIDSLNAYEVKKISGLLNSLQKYQTNVYKNQKEINNIYIPLVFQLTGIFSKKYFIDKLSTDIEFDNFIANMNSPKYICGNLEEIIEMSNYSHGYLCKIFKQRMGKTLKQYHMEIKVNYAITQLKNQNLSILDISNMLGYNSLSNFIKIFKQFTNYTPAKYRNIYLAQKN